jgi:DNA primase
VIFPIHNVTGKVIAFGARTLRSDKKEPKYLNSPETEIYVKSNILFGIHHAKRAIIATDNCYLVEGYTDVISMHQAGIENVVASSGTSLTTGQIRLIKRYTQNITILYDGDSAGIKASFRGIDMILEEGMNVRVLLFPDGEDPDSYSKKVSTEEYHDFIRNNTKDFILFKTDIL